MSDCEQACVECGNDIGIHHLCTHCLIYLGTDILESDTDDTEK